MSNVCRLLDRYVELQPDAPAITQRINGRDVTIRYAELQKRIIAESNRISMLGLDPGERVLMLCPFGTDLYVSVLAVFHCGLTAMFVDPGAGLRRLDMCCQAAKPRAVIATPKACLLRPFVRSLRWLPYWLRPSRSASTEGSLAKVVDVDGDHPALLTFTSGSTGTPKGVVRSHGFLELQQQVIAKELKLVAGQCELLTMPMFVLANLASGVHSVLGDVNLRNPKGDSAKKLASQLTSQRADRLLVSPSLVDQLADYCIQNEVSVDSLKRVTTGGAPVFPRTIRKLAKAFPISLTEVVYGSTEAEPISILNASEKMQSYRNRIILGEGLPAGKLAPDICVRLLSTEFRTTHQPLDQKTFAASCLAEGCTGEIIVQGPRVIRSYLGRFGDDQTKINVDGAIWHRTGDLGRIDSDGCLWLLGRITGRISDSHGTLEPLAVEAAAMENSLVQRCAIVAIGGQRVLVVELVEHASKDTAVKLKDQLAWSRLDRVLVVTKIPLDRRHHAKIDYPSLRLLVAADPPGVASTT